jgi:hypothetical protein
MVIIIPKKGTGSVLLFHAEVDISKENDLHNFDPKKYETFLDSRCQFHQRYLRAFFVQRLFQQLFCFYVWLGAKILYKKTREKR